MLAVLVRSTSSAMAEARLLPPRETAGELAGSSANEGDATASMSNSSY